MRKVEKRVTRRQEPQGKKGNSRASEGDIIRESANGAERKMPKTGEKRGTGGERT